MVDEKIFLSTGIIREVGGQIQADKFCHEKEKASVAVAATVAYLVTKESHFALREEEKRSILTAEYACKREKEIASIDQSSVSPALLPASAT